MINMVIEYVDISEDDNVDINVIIVLQENVNLILLRCWLYNDFDRLQIRMAQSSFGWKGRRAHILCIVTLLRQC